MRNSRIASRYAKGLLLLTEDNNDLAIEFHEHLVILSSLFQKKEIANILRSPVFSKELKGKIFDCAFSQINSKDVLKKFIHFLIEKNRIHLLPDLCLKYKTLLNKKNNLMEAALVSAKTIESGEFNQLKGALEKALRKNITLNQIERPELLGGFILDLGHSRLDLSLKGKLEALTEAAIR